jgi:glutathione S-transferase
MMDIYGSILSPYVARVALAARFKGLKHAVVMPKDGLKSPAFLKLNPLGKMPTLKDGKTVVYESQVILEYMEAKSRKRRLLPANAKAAASARLIAAVFGEYVQAPILALFRQRDPATRNQSVVDAKLAEIAKGLDVAESLIGKPFAAGKFSLADCYALPAVFYLNALLPQFGVTEPLGNRPKLKAYVAKLEKDKLTRGLLHEMTEELKTFRAR